MHVQTVLGAVSADELGPSLVHEHLLIGLACWLEAPTNPARQHLVDARVTPSLRGLLASDPYHCRDNLILDDCQLAIDELRHFRELGGGTLVDLTTRNIGPYPSELAEIARASGLNIVAGTGFYVARSHPEWIGESTVEKIAEFMVKEMLVGIGDTPIRAGIIGEIGTSCPIAPDEIKVLRAAASAQRQTGLAINVHLPIFRREGHNVLDVLDAAGADLTRVVLSHLDESMDGEHICALAKRGAFVELDTFGSELSFDESGEHEPSDWDRIDLLMELLDAGLVDRVLISQDVCNKIHLLHYGGYGYAHLLRTIVPRLKARGVDDRTLELLLVKNPATMLSGERKYAGT
jgi:phosphotriesterase-related protein